MSKKLDIYDRQSVCTNNPTESENYTSNFSNRFNNIVAQIPDYYNLVHTLGFDFSNRPEIVSLITDYVLEYIYISSNETLQNKMLESYNYDFNKTLFQKQNKHKEKIQEIQDIDSSDSDKVKHLYIQEIVESNLELISTLLQEIRDPFVEKFGWDQYYLGFHQYLAERGARFHGVEEQLIFFPTEDTRVLSVEGNSHLYKTPKELIHSLTKNSNIQITDIIIFQQPEKIGIMKLPLRFSANIMHTQKTNT
ncbi:MAG: hypothetical protein GY828_06720 [Candidatus Gracilibacteria bacterium]|nr:hypothetical protein [Candidatus Gracilibacteria bacterium]